MHQRNTPDTLGNGMVLKFQVRAKESSGIAFLLQARVEILIQVGNCPGTLLFMDTTCILSPDTTFRKFPEGIALSLQDGAIPSAGSLALPQIS